jgi:predicted enzyme related to lactoylglutathione lyase
VRVRGYAPATPCWAELVSADTAASAAFYGELFGWRAELIDHGDDDRVDEVGGARDSGTGGHVIFHLGDGFGGYAVCGAAAAPTANRPAAWLTYIATDDLAATVKRSVGSGGAVLQPPRKLGSRGRQALLAAPDGSVFAAWQKIAFAGAQAAAEPGTICWSELATRDPSSAVTFYGEVFGWSERTSEVTEGIDYSEWLAAGRAVAGMVEMDGRFPPDAPAHWRTIFEVEDCAGTAKCCHDLGGEVPLGPMDVGVGVFAQLVDGQGAPFGVIELVPELRAMLA